MKVVDEEMDGVAQDQRKRLRTIDDELEDVKRKLGRIWHVIETSDIDIADASDRIKEHRERKERLEDAAADARAILSEHRAHLDDVKTISAYAKDMRDFLNESELTERRAFIESFVKEVVAMPGNALLRYTVPISSSWAAMPHPPARGGNPAPIYAAASLRGQDRRGASPDP